MDGVTRVVVDAEDSGDGEPGRDREYDRVASPRRVCFVCFGACTLFEPSGCPFTATLLRGDAPIEPLRLRLWPTAVLDELDVRSSKGVLASLSFVDAVEPDLALLTVFAEVEANVDGSKGGKGGTGVDAPSE
jgi:hypothetical protein